MVRVVKVVGVVRMVFVVGVVSWSSGWVVGVVMIVRVVGIVVKVIWLVGRSGYGSLYTSFLEYLSGGGFLRTGVGG